MTNRILTTACLTLFSTLASAQTAAPPAAPSSPDAPRRLIEGIVVRVNDRILTTADLRDRVAERSAESGKPVPPEQYADIVKEATDEACLLERAVELKVEVSQDEVNAALTQLREQNHATDEATFASMLQAMGLSLDRFKQRLKETLLVNRVLSREVGNLPITQEELRQRYERDKDQFRVPERYHLEHLIVPLSTDGSDREAKLADARRLVAAARGSEPFLTLVNREVSAGHGTGGDLGTLALDDLRPEVRQVVEKLKPGETSDPFVSPAGVHVVRLVGITPPTVRPFAEVEAELRERELAERYRLRLRGVVDGLKTRYVVVVHPELFTAAS